MTNINSDIQKLRLDGIYPQNNSGDLMLRIKIPAGVLSSEQATKISIISDRYSNGQLHLTTRGNIELHWLHLDSLSAITSALDSVGLTTRGACGGAVRGISCNTHLSSDDKAVLSLARRLHRHFSGNPHFESLPKKFKISVESSYHGSRHLIQDVGLVRVGEKHYDVWIAGGLGRQPQEGFLLEKHVTEETLIPRIEAIIRTYIKHTPAPKRLKFLASTVGKDRLRNLIEHERIGHPEKFPFSPLDQTNSTGPTAPEVVEHPVFAGALKASTLHQLATIAAEHADGTLRITTDQNVSMVPRNASAWRSAVACLPPHAPSGALSDTAAVFRVCPGIHLCRMGLAPTRDIARQTMNALGPTGKQLSWAVSGCPNACSQPQLAEAGILTTNLVKEDDGNRTPRYALLRRTDESFAHAIAEDLSEADLIKAVAALD
ncbi:MAG: nitrite reductase [Desulfuromonas sp.]|nr:MAG: nitrite reductase [Desulfuromonas sp.]